MVFITQNVLSVTCSQLSELSSHWIDLPQMFSSYEIYKVWRITLSHHAFRYLALVSHLQIIQKISVSWMKLSLVINWMDYPTT